MNISDGKSLLYFILSYWTWKAKKKAVLPDMLYIFELEEVIKLIQVYGGTTLKIPTMTELSGEINEVMAAYLYCNENCNHDVIQQNLKINGTTYKAYKKRIKEWKKYIEQPFDFNEIFDDEKNKKENN